ncbi:MAG: sodium:solute symporter family protein [Planctomycetota bacterium]
MTPLFGILLYVGVQIGIGYWVSRKITTEDDYLVAGRRLGLPLVAGSIFATWFGAETCLGAAGQAYSEGLTRTSVEPFAYGLCLLLTGAIFAAPMWRAGVTTLADLHRKRFGPGVERIAALLLVPSSVLWAAAQVRAFGAVLTTAAPLDPEAAMALAAVVAIIYTVLGGLLADVLTDLLQAGVLVGCLVALLVVVLGEAGGAEAGWDLIAARVQAGATSGAPPASWLVTLEAWAVPLCGSVVAQEVLARSLAARSPSVARRAALVGGGAYLLVGLIPVTLGLLGPVLVPGLEDSERVLPALAERHLGGPAFILFAGALISAILSTVDSTLLVASSFLSRNLLLAGRTDVSQRTRLLVARGGVLVCGLVAWAIARGSEGVFELVEQASGFGSAGILVITVFALFVRREHRAGPRAAMASLLLGVLAWVLGRYVLDLPAPYLLSLAAALLGFLLGSLADVREREPDA